MNKIIIALAAVLLCSCTKAEPQANAPPPPQAQEMLDADGDETLALEIKLLKECFKQNDAATWLYFDMTECHAIIKEEGRIIERIVAVKRKKEKEATAPQRKWITETYAQIKKARLPYSPPATSD